MNIECMVPVEWLSDNFRAVEETVAKYGQAIIVVDNMPKYVMMKYSPKKEWKPLIDERDLISLLNGIGKRVFVQYYENFKNNDDPFVFFDHENFSDNSKRSRMSKARAIFKNGWERNALEFIMTSNRTDSESVKLASSLHTKYFGEAIDT